MKSMRIYFYFREAQFFKRTRFLVKKSKGHNFSLSYPGFQGIQVQLYIGIPTYYFWENQKECEKNLHNLFITRDSPQLVPLFNVIGCQSRNVGPNTPAQQVQFLSRNTTGVLG